MTYASFPAKFLNYLGGINLMPNQEHKVDNDNSLEFLVYFMLAQKKQMQPDEWLKLTEKCLVSDGLYSRLGKDSLISHDTIVNILTGSIVCGCKHISWSIYNYLVKNNFKYENLAGQYHGLRSNHTRQLYFTAHVYTCCGIVPPLWDQLLWSISLIYTAIKPDGFSGLCLAYSSNEALIASKIDAPIMSFASIVFSIIVFFRWKNFWNILSMYFSEYEIKQYCFNQAKNP